MNKIGLIMRAKGFCLPCRSGSFILQIQKQRFRSSPHLGFRGSAATGPGVRTPRRCVVQFLPLCLGGRCWWRFAAGVIACHEPRWWLWRGISRVLGLELPKCAKHWWWLDRKNGSPTGELWAILVQHIHWEAWKDYEASNQWLCLFPCLSRPVTATYHMSIFWVAIFMWGKDILNSLLPFAHLIW